ncbi:MAG: hypothetical protein Q9224_005454, partial [Gallowayella concinna]
MAAFFERLEYRVRAALHSLSHPTFQPSVYPTLPPLSLLNIVPPPSEPQSLPPPVHDATVAKPFNVSSEIYNNALSVYVPISIAFVYAVGAWYWNRVNRQRNNKPSSFSKTTSFYLLVMLHNSLLAAYSAWTFIGMLNAFGHTWPGWEGEHKLARAVDSLCKIHGPRGFGSAATFNSNKGVWSFTDRTMKLDQYLPDTTDVGRLWNEGLAFYGWLFYLSKFYEVVDTAIILAKGKNTTPMQVFHHAGAMLSTWAGIRYMSPPIWMFVTLNSGIHTLMYTYYIFTHMGIQVPRLLKSALTTMQIVQIVFGTSYALAHLFIAYHVPVEVPYLFIHNLSSALPTAASSVSSAIASATASADIGSWLKKAALRAAGEEGLAENVRNSQGQTFGIDAVHAAEVEKAQEEIRYKSQYQSVNCLDTSGQTFAILLNFLYLAPLAYMFIHFFINNYVKQNRGFPPPLKTDNVRKSGKKAGKDLRKELREAMGGEQEGLETDRSDLPSQVADQSEKINKGAKDISEKARNAASDAADRVRDGAHQANDAIQDPEFRQKAKNAASNAADRVKDGAHQANDVLQEKGQQATEALSDKVNEMNKKAKSPKEGTSHSKDTQDNKGTGNDEGAKEQPKPSKGSSDMAPKLEPTSSSDGTNKPNSRSVSPHKRTQLPQPSSKNRQSSPEKKDQGTKGKDTTSKEEAKPQMNGDGASKEGSKNASKGETDRDEEEKPSSLDESAYEVNPDELENEEEKKAEAEMQP